MAHDSQIVRAKEKCPSHIQASVTDSEIKSITPGPT